MPRNLQMVLGLVYCNEVANIGKLVTTARHPAAAASLLGGPCSRACSGLRSSLEEWGELTRIVLLRANSPRLAQGVPRG